MTPWRYSTPDCGVSGAAVSFEECSGGETQASIEEGDRDAGGFGVQKVGDELETKRDERRIPLVEVI
jgi:hypothetical protein